VAPELRRGVDCGACVGFGAKAKEEAPAAVLRRAAEERAPRRQAGSRRKDRKRRTEG